MRKGLLFVISALLVLMAISVATAKQPTTVSIAPIWNPNGVWGAGAVGSGDEYAGSYGGVDHTNTSYLYNWPQQYVTSGTTFPNETGPHGGYTTSTNKCRDCHAVHQAFGAYKLLRANARFEVCDFCHGLGSGAGKNIKMDNNYAEAPNYVTEYDQGHSLNYGDGSTSYRAPDDSSPAWYPREQPSGETGFACQDCHSPHATPVRIATIVDNGDANDSAATANSKRFFLLKNPDSYDGADDSILVNGVRTNKRLGGITSWGVAVALSSWCADCHDANIGAYQNKDVDGETTTNAIYCWDQETTGYALAFSHDCATSGWNDAQTQYYDSAGVETTSAAADGWPDVNPDDANDGPTCRQCHASTANGVQAVDTSTTPATQNWDLEQDWWVAATHLGPTAYGGDVDIYQSELQEPGTGDLNWIVGDGGGDQEGYSFPHRSVGYKLLKGDAATDGSNLDTVCLNCHRYDATDGYYLP